MHLDILTEESTADVFGNLISRLGGFREVRQLFVQHPLELQTEKKRALHICN